MIHQKKRNGSQIRFKLKKALKIYLPLKKNFDENRPKGINHITEINFTSLICINFISTNHQFTEEPEQPQCDDRSIP